MKLRRECDEIEEGGSVVCKEVLGVREVSCATRC
jgi:hypothetical protein